MNRTMCRGHLILLVSSSLAVLVLAACNHDSPPPKQDGAAKENAGVSSDNEPAATRAAQDEWHGFPRIPPIANADPSIREEREILVPTRLRIRRSENRISVEVDPDSLESIILDVGADMLIGFRREMSVYRDGQPVSSGGHGLGGSWYFGTRHYNTSEGGFPRPGETYEVEVRIQVFETDIPAQHFWMPGSPKYKVLWTRTLRQST